MFLNLPYQIGEFFMTVSNNPNRDPLQGTNKGVQKQPIEELNEHKTVEGHFEVIAKLLNQFCS